MNDDNYWVLLHKIAPLSKLKQTIIWFKIKRKLHLGLMYRIDKNIKRLGLVFIGVLLMLTTITTRADMVVLEAEKAGWDAIIVDDELKISAVNPMIVEKDEVCVLWVEIDNTITKLAELPEDGNIYMTLDDELIEHIDLAQVFISIEDKDNITQPHKIEYAGVVQ